MTQLVEQDSRKAPQSAGAQRYLGEFDRTSADRAGEPVWLRHLRRGAIERFGEVGFPTTHDEEWKFTNVRPIAETPFVAADGAGSRVAGEVEPFSFGDAASEIIFLNGVAVRGLTAGDELASDVYLSGLADVIATGDTSVEPWLSTGSAYSAFSALNTAFFCDGAVLRVPPNAIVERPIHLLFFSTSPNGPFVTHPRVIIIVGENSQVSVVESYAGSPGQRYLTNAVSHVVLGPNAVVDHYKVQRESRDGFHVGQMHVRTSRSSTFSSHSLTFGGSIVRNDIVAVLDGEGGDCTLNGLYLATGQQLVDNHTTIDHAKPHCGSHEVYKGVLGGRARAVFNGKIIVRPDAQKTDAKQTNRALLLSDEAQINTKPQLEIFANDVRCTHGATIGQLDDDAIFYLRSRGLSLGEARRVLIHAFAGDILNRVKVEPVRLALERSLEQQLPLGGA